MKITTTSQLITELSKRFTKAQMADKTGFALRNFYDWANGSEMRFSTAFEICSKLGLDLIQLLSEKG